MNTCIYKNDAVYLIGASHIGHFSEYLMIECTGLNMMDTPVGLPLTLTLVSLQGTHENNE